MVQPGKQQITKEELEKILQVNSKAIELEMENAQQNERIIESFEESQKEHETIKKLIVESKGEILKQNDSKHDSQNKIIDEMNKILKEVKDFQFRIMVILSVASVSLIIEIVKLLKFTK